MLYPRVLPEPQTTPGGRSPLLTQVPRTLPSLVAQLLTPIQSCEVRVPQYYLRRHSLQFSKFLAFESQTQRPFKYVKTCCGNYLEEIKNMEN